MSVFSKIFIVINLGLTLLLTGVMGSLLAQKADHLANYSESHREYRTAMASLKAEREDGKQLIGRLRTQATEETQKAEEATKQLTQLSGERKAKESQLNARLKNKNELYTKIKELNKRNNDLNDQVKTLVTLRNEANSTKETAVGTMNRAFARLEEVRDDVASAEQATTNVKSMQRQFLTEKATLESMIRAAKKAGINVEKYATDLANQAGKIEGVVTNVSAGVYLVMIDVGKNDGVNEDMVFSVQRGAKYICKIKVRKVFPSQASALIMTDHLVEGRMIKTGDIVKNH